MEGKAVAEGQGCSFWKEIRCLHRIGHGICVRHVIHIPCLVSVVKQR